MINLYNKRLYFIVYKIKGKISEKNLKINENHVPSCICKKKKDDEIINLAKLKIILKYLIQTLITMKNWLKWMMGAMNGENNPINSILLKKNIPVSAPPPMAPN